VRRRSAWVTAALAALLGACTSASPPLAAASPLANAAATPSPNAAACAGRNPLDHVYSPIRLYVRDPCRTATGTVMDTLFEPDGGWHIGLRLDRGQLAIDCHREGDRERVQDRVNHGHVMLGRTMRDRRAIG